MEPGLSSPTPNRSSEDDGEAAAVVWPTPNRIVGVCLPSYDKESQEQVPGIDLSIVQAEADFDGRLPMGDFVVGNVAPDFGQFKPF